MSRKALSPPIISVSVNNATKSVTVMPNSNPDRVFPHCENQAFPKKPPTATDANVSVSRILASHSRLEEAHNAKKNRKRAMADRKQSLPNKRAAKEDLSASIVAEVKEEPSTSFEADSIPADCFSPAGPQQSLSFPSANGFLATSLMAPADFSPPRPAPYSPTVPVDTSPSKPVATSPTTIPLDILDPPPSYRKPKNISAAINFQKSNELIRIITEVLPLQFEQALNELSTSRSSVDTKPTAAEPALGLRLIDQLRLRIDEKRSKHLSNLNSPNHQQSLPSEHLNEDESYSLDRQYFDTASASPSSSSAYSNVSSGVTPYGCSPGTSLLSKCKRALTRQSTTGDGTATGLVGDEFVLNQVEAAYQKATNGVADTGDFSAKLRSFLEVVDEHAPPEHLQRLRVCLRQGHVFVCRRLAKALGAFALADIAIFANAFVAELKCVANASNESGETVVKSPKAALDALRSAFKTVRKHNRALIGRKRTAGGKAASSKAKRVKRVKKDADAKPVKKKKKKSTALSGTNQYVPKWERRFKGHKCSEECGVESDGKVDTEEIVTHSSEHKRIVEKYFPGGEPPACNERRMLMVYDYQGSLCCTFELQPDPPRETLDTRAEELRKKYEEISRQRNPGITGVSASTSMPAMVVHRSDSHEKDLLAEASTSAPPESSAAFVVPAQATNESSPRKNRCVSLVPEKGEDIAKKAMEMMRLKTMFVCNSRAPKARVLSQHIKPPSDSSSIRRSGRIQREKCIDLHPSIQRCRVCAGETGQDIPEVCRFQDFRRLITCKFIGRPLRADSFATAAHDMSKLKQWLPDASNDSFVRGLTEKSACYTLQNIRPMFEQILHFETLAKEVAKKMNCEGPFLKPLCGARELCDLCDGTIFNLHYFCQACCFTICLACLLKRLKKFRADEAIEADNMYVDKFDWPLCRIGEEHFPHNPTKLSLGQMIPDDPADGVGTTLFKLAKSLDYVAEKFHIPNGKCACPDSLSGAEDAEDEASMVAQETAEAAPTASTSAASFSSDVFGTPLMPSCYCAKMEAEGSAVPRHEYACGDGDEKLLIIHEPEHESAFEFFQQQWRQFKPIVVSSIHKKLDANLWRPESFLSHCKDEMSYWGVVDCRTGTVYKEVWVSTFWNGFMDPSLRLDNKIWKLKDWPSGGSFAERMREHYKDLTQALPIPIYTLPDSGGLNLVTRLPASMYLPPDLGPKMYNAFEMGFDNEKGTTNLHLDISDAVNLLVCVRCPKKGQAAEEDATVRQKFYEEMMVRIKEICDDEVSLKRAQEKPEEAGAIWTIFKPEDTEVIRDYLKRRQRAKAKQMRSPFGVDSESASATPVDSDVIHDQLCYVTKTMRDELLELNVRGFSFVQMLGDAVFIPAGATHQVHNLQCCIKVAEDFVSPEGVLCCSKVASEFRRLSRIHTNHEDILQLENIIYHAVKDSVSYLLRKIQNKDAIDIPFEVKATVTESIIDAKADSKSDAGAAPDADADSDANFDPFAGKETRRAAALDGTDFAPSFYGETPEQQIVPPLNPSSRLRGQHASVAYKHKVVQYAMAYGKTQARLHFRETTAHVSRWCKDVDNISAKFAMEQSALAAGIASSNAEPCTPRQSAGGASATASESQCSSSQLEAEAEEDLIADPCGGEVKARPFADTFGDGLTNVSPDCSETSSSSSEHRPKTKPTGGVALVLQSFNAVVDPEIKGGSAVISSAQAVSSQSPVIASTSSESYDEHIVQDSSACFDTTSAAVPDLEARPQEATRPFKVSEEILEKLKSVMLRSKVGQSLT